MGPAPRERYNAKARQATAGGSKKKGKIGKRNLHINDKTPDSDPNALFHTPKTNEEKELDRKEKLKQEVCLSSSQIGSGELTAMPACRSIGIEMDEQEKEKTRKVYRALYLILFWNIRLIVHIQDKKLKKEERVHLFEKLSYVCTCATSEQY